MTATFIVWHWIYRTHLWIRNWAFYIRYPRLIFITLTLSYYYQLYFSAGRFHFEASQIDKAGKELTPGNTPVAALLPVLSKISNIHKKTIVDLGCGKGLLAMSLATIYKCNVIGFDLFPSYIRVATRLVEREKLQNITFIQSDFLLADLDIGDIFYVTLTCLDDTTIQLLSQKLALIRHRILVISASAPLPSEYFRVIKQYPAYFSWGKGMIYIHKKR